MRLPARRHDEGGAISIVVALLSVGLLLIAGFTVDFGQAYLMKRNLQTGADAASLAGAEYFMDRLEEPCSPTLLAPYSAGAEAQADGYMKANVPAAVTVGDNLTERCEGTAVRAYYSTSADTPMVFGGLATGGSTITTGREAEASFLPGGAGHCALCFLSPAGIDAGNADFTVYGGGSIHVNGNISTGPNNFWTAGGSITISGTSAPSQSQFSPDWTTAPPIADPFASMSMPLPTAGLSTRSSPCTSGPGVYGAVDLPNAACTLAPGAYVVTGKWLAGNNTVVSGNGVTLYVQGPNGELDFKNGSTQNLTAPTTSPLAGWPSGFVVIYDRSNTRPFSIQGNGSPTIGGIVYLPSSSIDFNGNSCLVINDGALIAKDVVKANGNQACLTMNHATNAGHGAPPTGLHLTE